MTTLLIDAGNTRVKWAWLFDGKLSEQRAEAHAAWNSSVAQQQLAQTAHIPQRVLVSNVAGPTMAEMLKTAIENSWGIKPSFVHSSARVANVSNGYKIPEQLGVDRWLGVIAAFTLEHRACCVVNVGTAMTVDAVTDGGQHLGGIIVPGPALMLKSLFANTSDISARAREGNRGLDLFADNTQAAVHQGIANALAATVERAAEELQKRTGSQPAILMTGGAREHVIAALRIKHRIVDDLVLRGLAEIARESAEKMK